VQNQPNVFWYLDRDGIESLFAQTVDRVETEIRESAEQSVTKKGGAKLGLGKAIAALLGLEVGAELEASNANKRLQETKSALTVEHKLARLREYLSDSNNLEDNLATAVTKASQADASVFVDVYEPFDAPQFTRSGGVIEINRDGAIVFEINERFGAVRIVMSSGLSKYPSAAGGRLSPVSHAALHFRGFGGKNVPLHVFGYIRSITSETFQIKPFAIW
jgi:hypothetical protein